MQLCFPNTEPSPSPSSWTKNFFSIQRIWRLLLPGSQCPKIDLYTHLSSPISLYRTVLCWRLNDPHWADQRETVGLTEARGVRGGTCVCLGLWRFRFLALNTKDLFPWPSIWSWKLTKGYQQNSEVLPQAREGMTVFVCLLLFPAYWGVLNQSPLPLCFSRQEWARRTHLILPLTEWEEMEL